MELWNGRLLSDHYVSAGRFKTLPAAGGEPPLSNWNVMSGVFSVTNLKGGAFANLPSAHIGELLDRLREPLRGILHGS